MNPNEMQRAIIALKKDLRAAVELLKAIQTRRFHEPNPDFYEYCNGCGRSPNNKPPHDPDCLVVAVGSFLRRISTPKRARRG